MCFCNIGLHLVLFLDMLKLNYVGVLCVCHVIELRMLSEC